MAAQELRNHYGIQTNLFLVSGLIHAAACAEAGATTVTFAVGPVSEHASRQRSAVLTDQSGAPVTGLAREEA